MAEPLPLRILIVEDDPDTCSNLTDVLELDEHVVSSVGSAAEALAHPALQSVAVVLLDRKLPDATAEGLLPRLKVAVPETDVIVITGHADIESAIAALRLGAADYILKPINVDLLRASLRRIAERRRAEERATALGRFLEESLNEIYVYDAESLQYLLVNRGARENLGYSMDELRTMTAYDVKPGFARASFEELIGALRTGEERVRFEAVHRRKDGSTYPIELYVQLSTLDFKPVFVSTGLDVTERKHAEERLLQSERLAAIGEAMTSLAHESRNALQRSQACLEMLARRVEENSEALHLVNRIQVAQDDLHQLYEEVRAYAAPLKIRPQPCGLAEILQEAWDELALKRQGRAAELLQNGPPVDLRCHVDRFALRQVFRNVFENALAACNDPVEIETRCEDVATDAGAAVRLSIRDNGPGLTPEQRAQIFDAFYTTKTQGTGLGMAICKRIVEAHGGEIAVGDGPGAEILITLPRSQPASR